MAKQRKPIMSVERIVNLGTLAVLMDVTPQTIREWRRAGMPEHERKAKEVMFDIAKVVQWRIERAAGETGDDSKSRKLKAEAERIEMQNAESRGDLVRRDAVEREAREDAERVKQAILSVPPRIAEILASETNPALVEATITRELTEALQELSAQEPEDEADAA